MHKVFGRGQLASRRGSAFQVGLLAHCSRPHDLKTSAPSEKRTEEFNNEELPVYAD
jgi:hypothetical protein